MMLLKIETNVDIDMIRKQINDKVQSNGDGEPSKICNAKSVSHHQNIIHDQYDNLFIQHSVDFFCVQDAHWMFRKQSI